MADLDITTALANYAGMVRGSVAPVGVPDGTHMHCVIPAGYQIASLEKFVYNDYAKHPHRTKQDVTVYDTGSFIDYYNAFQQPDSRMFADNQQNQICGIIDYHSHDTPRWLSHTCTLQLRLSTEFKTWKGSNEKQMSQADMALFIEDNYPDVVVTGEGMPSAATMMEVARTFQANETSMFEGAVRLDNGDVRMAYRKETQATAGAGQIVVPDRFAIAIPVYEGMPDVQIRARLRYRISSGKLSLWYSLWRLDEVLMGAFHEVLETVVEQCGPVLLGHP